MKRTYGTITVKPDKVEIECEAHVAVRLKRWFPKIPRGTIGKLTLSASDENARELFWFTGVLDAVRAIRRIRAPDGARRAV